MGPVSMDSNLAMDVKESMSDEMRMIQLREASFL